MTKPDPAPEPDMDIPAIPESPEARQTEARFAAMESKSMLSARSLAFLHHLVLAMRPDLVLEIGTYFAGTSRILADALAESGNGSLITLDPDDGREAIVEKALEDWPENVREVTRYLHLASDDFFVGLTAMPEVNFDLMFVDGNHSYLAALGDLLNCAERATAKAVIVVDDYDQPNVFLAVRDFMKVRPDWQEVSGVFDQGLKAAPFEGMRSSLDGIPFLVLQGPAITGISARPRSWYLRDFRAASVTNIELALAPGQGGGQLFANIILDSVTGVGVDTSHRVLEMSIAAGASSAVIKLDPPLTTVSSDRAFNNTCEVTLVWEGKDGPQPLSLNAPPTFNTA